MKKLFTFITASLIVIILYAQSPEKMNFQAVVRDNNNNLITNTVVGIRITILQNSTPVYFETQRPVTNSNGLITIAFGGEAGFNKIDWANGPYFIKSEIDPKGGSNYTITGTSQLMSVPYAFHAQTASYLIDEDNQILKSTDKGVPSQNWSLFGNSKSNPLKDKLGTTDKTDLVFVTDNIERLRITSNGDINLKKSFEIGEDLTVKRNVYLNTESGETINNGPLTVSNGSPTLLRGSLTVDGSTHLNNTLTVESATDLHGALNVDGETDLNNALNVNNQSPTLLTGSLSVEGPTHLKSTLTVEDVTDLQSALNVDGPTHLKSTLIVEEITSLKSDLNVEGNSKVKKLNASGQVNINALLPTGHECYNNYPLQVEGSQQGLAIKLTATDPGRSNNFVSFWGGDGEAKGRIEGMDRLTEIARKLVTDILTTPDSTNASKKSTDKMQAAPSVNYPQLLNNNYAFGAYSLTLNFVTSIIRFSVNFAASKGTACIFADCDDVIWSAVDLVKDGIQLGGYIAYNEVNRGVAFESGGADYAEWLMKNDTTEVFTFGDVVGIKGGLISKKFKKAEKYMVISKDPTVIGAMPEEANRKYFEKIAFMGQVSVKVIGKVNKSDYILPSGNGDGMAIAVSPNAMTARDYSRIIGISWGESDGKKVFDYVNTAVGINSNDMAGVIENMQSLLNDMQIALANVAPGFEPQLYAVGARSVIDTNPITKSQTLQDIIGIQSDALQYTSIEEALYKAKDYAQSQNLDLSQYPYLAEMFENPSIELAEEILAHYTEVLNRLTALMAEAQKN
jgi:cytoskeletal protein CcmA (bactofilin family)